MQKISATQKGMLTGLAMIVMSFIIYFSKGNFDNNLQYITYSIYVLGIVWTLINFSKQDNHQHKFGGYFLQGFKCFIVVTLLMVVFTACFLYLHPEMKQQMQILYKADLEKQGNSTPAEIEEKIKLAGKSFLPVMLMSAIFGYLVIGAMVTAIGAAFLNSKNKKTIQ